MARHEDIVNTIWDDLDHLGNDAFLLYVWSWTNTKCGMAGLYPVTRRTLLEGRLDAERRDAAIAELEADDKLYYLEGVLWNKARVSHLAGFAKGQMSEVIVRSILKDLRAVAPHPLVDRFVERYGDHPSMEGHLTLYRPSPEGQDCTEECGSADGLQTVQGQGQGQGQGQYEPSAYSTVLAELERIAFARSIPSPDPAAVARACEDHPGRDFDAEAKRFAAYWIDGPGEKRSLKKIAWAWRNWLERAKAPEGSPAPEQVSKYDRHVRRAA